MPDQVIVVELPDEARTVAMHLGEAGRSSSERVVVALEPEGRAILREQGIECRDTISYFDSAAHARCLEKTDELVKLAEQDLRLDVGNGLEGVFMQAFVDQALISWRLAIKTIEVLHGIGRAHPEATLVVSGSGASGTGIHRPPGDQWFLDSLMPRFCRQYRFPLQIIPPAGPACASATVGSGAMEAGARGSGGGMVAAGHRLLNTILDWSVSRCVAAALLLQSRSASVLTPEPTARIVSFLGALRTRFPGVKPLVLDWRDRSPRRELKVTLYWLLNILLPWKTWEWLPRIPLNAVKVPAGERDELLVRARMESAVADFLARNGEHFAHRGVSFLQELRTKASVYWIACLLELWKVAQAQAHVLARLRPSLGLAGHSLRGAHVFGGLCQGNGIPAMVISVKMLVKPKNSLEAIGQDQYGRYFVSDEYPFAAAQTPQALGYLTHSGYAGQVICTGPLIRSKVGPEERARRRQVLFQKEGGPVQVVVFAPSMRRAPAFYVVQSLDEVIRSMADVVGAVKSLEGVHLILRLHPSFSELLNTVETLVGLPPGVSLSDSGRLGFDDVLALAEVIVSNASTAVEEAILSGVPAILYDKWARYNALDAPQVTTGMPEGLSPAYYVAREEHLATTLDWVLRNHPPGRLLPAAMLERYAFQEDLSQNFYELVGRMVPSRNRPLARRDRKRNGWLSWQQK